MWPNNTRWLLRRLKDSLAAFLMGIGILLPPGSANATKPPSDPEKQTIEERVANVRERLRLEHVQQQARQNAAGSAHKSEERLTQWYNWPNWGNWGNWPNWPNWPNYWFNR